MHLVAWQNGVPQDIGGGAFSSASVVDMNGAGNVLGSVTIPPNTNRAVLWDGTSATDLGTLPGGNWTSGAALNDAGGVVVSAQDYSRQVPCRSMGRIRPDRTLGPCQAAINRSPRGSTSKARSSARPTIDATHLHGFVIDDGVMYDINDLRATAFRGSRERSGDLRLGAHPRIGRNGAGHPAGAWYSALEPTTT